MYGWVGKLLRVNLTTEKIWTEDTMEYDVRNYLGGRGLAARIAWKEIGPEVGPFDPENRLMFLTGPLTGTPAPTSGRGIICSVSPRAYPRPWFTRSGIGGFWAPELKYAGYDGLIIQGRAEKPIYLLIHNNHIELKDASKLWGKGAISTQMQLRNIHGKDFQTLAIGPAGENLIRWSTIQHGLSNASGMPGFGAVMGSKLLKAIVIKGAGGIRIARPKEFLEACKYVEELIRPGPTLRAKFGNPIPSPNTTPCSHACPVNCFARIYKNIRARIGEGVINMMSQCAEALYIWGFNRTEYPTENIKEVYQGDIKTRPTPGFGEEFGVELQTLGEDLGLCGRTYIVFYAWFGACIDNGISEINGFELNPDRPEWWYEFLKKVAFREGLGDIFAEGLTRAIERLDVPEILKKTAMFLEPAWGFPAHRLGRATESQPSPLWIFSMLHWIVDTRNPMSNTHQSSFTEYWFPPHHGGGDPEVSQEKLKRTFERVFGTSKVIEPGFEPIDVKVRAAIWHQHRSVLKDSLLLCDWCFPRILKVFGSEMEFYQSADYYGDINSEIKLLNPATGLDLTLEELERICERIFNLERALQVRNYDRSREVDSSMEWYFEYPEKSDGTKLNKEIFDCYLEEYYRQRGWDELTGWPTREKLEELGLEEVASALEKSGKLPQP